MQHSKNFHLIHYHRSIRISNKQRQMIKYKHAIGEGNQSDTEAIDIESESTSDGESEQLSIEIITDEQN